MGATYAQDHCGVVAVGAIVLANRRVAARALGGPVAWTGLGVGSSLLSAMYIVQGTTLVSLAENYAGDEAVYESMWTGFRALFGIGALLFTVAATLVFLGEARSNERHVPTWVAWLGAAGWLVAIMAPVGILTGADMMGVTSWTALTGFLAFAHWGSAHAIPSLQNRTSTTSTTGRARPA